MLTLWLLLSGCAATNVDLGNIAGRPVHAKGLAQVVVVRDELHFPEATYALDVNGRGWGLLDTREYQVVDVEPGSVRVEVKDQAPRVVRFNAAANRVYFFRVSSRPGLSYPTAKLELLDAQAGVEAAQRCRPAATHPDDGA